MALPPHFLDELRARTPMSALVSRRVKLARSGRQWKGCCPFHGEKSPSFYVYEDGYHCFGCGAHGDAISFVMQTQGAGFMEAVQSLAAEAGLEVPKATPEAAEAERRRLDLHGVLDAACAAYRRRLRTPDGAGALAYLVGRGLTEATIEAFGLGWSGEGRGALAAELAPQGVTPEQLLQAGLLRESDNGPPRELFYNRVMFPIRDRTGRIISFGGRILGDGQPKYVNGPETELFSKRRTLYALDRAREAVRPKPGAEPAEVVAVEGYMDVIALHQAGFGAAVAPLGTALTAEQLEALWRLSPTPVLCFDGDGAGTRAAARAADVALPLLGTERSLSIATLPSGQDPDTLVRAGGPAAFRAVLAARTGLPAAIFALTRAQVGDGSEEQRARLAQALDDKAKLIPHAALSYEFRTTFRGLMNAQRQAARAKAFGSGGAGRPAFGTGGRGGAGGGRAGSPGAGPRLHAPFTEPDAAAERRRHLAAIMLYHPALVHDVEEAWCSLELPEAQARVRDAILSWSEHAEQLDSPALIAHLHSSGLGDEVARITSSQPLPLSAPALADAMPAEAEAAWWHYFGQLNLSELEREVEAAAVALRESLTDATSRRMITLKGALNRLRSGEQGEEPGL
ncbi:MAG: DNA primase [Janthinobacterium lividum]